MSNPIHIEPTEFTNIRTGGITWGVRVYDDNFNFYSNLWEKSEVPDDDIELIIKVIEELGDEPDVSCAMDYVQEHHGSVTVGNEVYCWEEIKDCFDG